MTMMQFMLRATLALLLALSLAGQANAQKKKDDAPPPTGIDAATGKILTEAIEALNKENYSGAKAAIARLKLDSLSPYERSRTEQILATIESSQDNYTKARCSLPRKNGRKALQPWKSGFARPKALTVLLTTCLR